MKWAEGSVRTPNVFTVGNEGSNDVLFINGRNQITPNNEIQSTPVPRKIILTETEKKAVIAYLNTFTDYNVITDPKFSDPFVSE